MLAGVLKAYIQFAGSGVGGITLVALSIAACAALVRWARRRDHQERHLVFLMALGMTVLGLAVYTFAVLTGWWSGTYFRIPLIVQLAVLAPLSAAVWTAWLLGYGWLADHSRQPLATYTFLGVLIVLAVSVADRLELTGGLVEIARDGATWIDALVAVAVMMAPVVLFEGIRRALARTSLLP